MSVTEMKRAKKNQLTVKISTFDADVEFDVKPKCTGQDVFNLACVTFGVRETWYFGLQFIDSRAPPAPAASGWWLRPDRRLADVARGLQPGARLQFLFHVRFWVEDVAEDLLLEATVHLFYLEVKDLVLTRQQWSATPELLLLLAAYAAQAELGDFDQQQVGTPPSDDGGLLSRFLPGQFPAQAGLEPAACEEKLRDHYRDLAGLGRAEAELEMLRLAQDLEMFGLIYFPIQCCSGPSPTPGEQWLGVSCFGVSFYEQDTLVKPYRRLAWSEIRHMSCRDRKFHLMTTGGCAPGCVSGVGGVPGVGGAGQVVTHSTAVSCPNSSVPGRIFGRQHRGGIVGGPSGSRAAGTYFEEL